MGMAETVVGVGGEDVGGVSGFTSQPSFAGSDSRFVAVAARSSQRLFNQGSISALDIPATGSLGCS
jgi:hypothetical protein